MGGQIYYISRQTPKRLTPTWEFNATLRIGGADMVFCVETRRLCKGSKLRKRASSFKTQILY